MYFSAANAWLALAFRVSARGGRRGTGVWEYGDSLSPPPVRWQDIPLVLEVTDLHTPFEGPPDSEIN